MSFTTLESVKLFLSKEELTPLQENQVAGLITMVDEVICNYCGWPMLAADYEGEEYDGNGTTELDLGRYPLNSVTQVLLADEDVTADIKVSRKDGIILFADNATVFTSGRLNVEVDFNAGYAEGSIPKDLEYAANYLVVINLNQIEDGTIGLKSDKLEDVTTEFNYADLPKLVTRVLDRYRLVRIV